MLNAQASSIPFCFLLTQVLPNTQLKEIDYFVLYLSTYILLNIIPEKVHIWKTTWYVTGCPYSHMKFKDNRISHLMF